MKLSTTLTTIHSDKEMQKKLCNDDDVLPITAILVCKYKLT